MGCYVRSVGYDIAQHVSSLSDWRNRRRPTTQVEEQISQSMKTVEVPQSVLDGFHKLPTATVFGAVSRLGSPRCVMEGVRTFTPGRRLAARARTLRFLPVRPDLVETSPAGEGSAEYEAMARCGPGDALVGDMMNKQWSAIGGDVKLVQLQMNNADGVVCDGAIRDRDVIVEEEYGIAVYAQNRTILGKDGIFPVEENVDIQCGGVLVRPGDVLVGDDDGLVVVPSWMAEAVLEHATEREEVENYVKRKIRSENVRPGKYYPPTPEMFEEYRETRSRG